MLQVYRLFISRPLTTKQAQCPKVQKSKSPKVQKSKSPKVLVLEILILGSKRKCEYIIEQSKSYRSKKTDIRLFYDTYRRESRLFGV
jgi:hypothetical protein